MDELKKFELEVEKNIENLSKDKFLKDLSLMWLRDVAPHKYSYNFRWLGRPAIMLPTDGWAVQELIWELKPDLIIEAGVAHGGSLIYYASILALLDISEAIKSQQTVEVNNPKRKVIGIDVDIRQHNRAEIEKHPMFNWIELIEGSSLSEQVIEKVRDLSVGHENIMVILDSNHTHDHVLAELEAYAPMVTVGSYCIVYDTIIEDMPENQHPDRPWGKGNNSKTAVWEFLANNPNYVTDKKIEDKLQITVGPDGYIKRLR